MMARLTNAEIYREAEAGDGQVERFAREFLFEGTTYQDLGELLLVLAKRLDRLEASVVKRVERD